MVGDRRLAVSVLALMWACQRKAAPEPTIQGKHAAVRLDPKDGELASQLEAQAGKARARGLRPFVELRADWCEPCKKLEAGGPEVDAVLEGTYLVQLDVDAWSGKLAGFSTPVIPYFFEIDERGRVTGRKTAYSEDGKALAAFFSGGNRAGAR